MKFQPTVRYLALALALAATTDGARADFASGYDSNGSVTIVPYEWGGVPATSRPTVLLSEFSFEYASSDHHVRRIRMDGAPYIDWEDDPYISLNFEDKNGDDAIWYRVGHYNVVPGFGESYVESGSCTGRCYVYVGNTRPSSSHAFALSEFSLDFGSGKDHHIDEIAIQENGDWLYVAFNDKNDDDRFDYRVVYTWLHPDAWEYQDDASGTRARDRQTVSRDEFTVLRGFRFDYEPDCTGGSDHHLKKIAIDPTSITYRDKNGDDCYDWELRWLKLEELYAWE